MNFIMFSLHNDVIKTVLREIFLISCGNTQAFFCTENSQGLSFSITLIVVVLLSFIVDAKKEKK